MEIGFFVQPIQYASGMFNLNSCVAQNVANTPKMWKRRWIIMCFDSSLNEKNDRKKTEKHKIQRKSNYTGLFSVNTCSRFFCVKLCCELWCTASLRRSFSFIKLNENNSSAQTFELAFITKMMYSNKSRANGHLTMDSIHVFQWAKKRRFFFCSAFFFYSNFSTSIKEIDFAML